MVSRTKAKAFQLRIKFDIPKELLDLLNQLPADISKKAMRAGVRAAMRPMRTHLKSLTKSISRGKRGSRQSTGATHRAVELKYGSPRNKPLNFYGIVGINRRVVETLTARAPEQSKGRVLQYQYAANTKRDAQRKRALRMRLKKLGPQEVRSFYRRKRRSTRKPVKRQPSRYFHLIDLGFKHRKGSQFSGYKWLDKVYNQGAEKAQQELIRGVTTRIQYIFNKMKSK